jgi:hypothetical protein
MLLLLPLKSQNDLAGDLYDLAPSREAVAAFGMIRQPSFVKPFQGRNQP